MTSLSSCVLGIDLGTSNCSLSYVLDDGTLDTFFIPQTWDRDKTHAEPLLPSFLYLENSENPILGFYAKQQSAMNPDHVISGSKSWLCHPYVDRRAPILPWGHDLPKGLSPVECAKELLQHMATTFVEQKKISDIKKVVVTIPASFDETARVLTLEACAQAGFGVLPILLEEPMAAFYGWLESQGENWRNHLSPGDQILVCDVGGGTTDFSLFSVSEDSDGQLDLKRLSVGPHLLLGGDNMDLALAINLKGNQNLDIWQMQSLIHQARVAKEALFSDVSLTHYTFSIASKSAKLFSNTLNFNLTRDVLESIIVDGFFPESYSDGAHLNTESLEEFGLPYEMNPSITDHLLTFLKESQGKPTKILFNGGAFKAKILKNRVLEILKKYQKSSVSELPWEQLELGVCRGAAYFARLLETQEGIRVKAGAPRSYYIGIAPRILAVPGNSSPPLSGLCLLPLGTEAGSILSYKNRPFFLKTGEKTKFHLFSSRVRPDDILGTVVPSVQDDLTPVATLEVVNFSEENLSRIPVFLTVRYDHVGCLSLSLEQMDHPERTWNLEFDLKSKK